MEIDELSHEEMEQVSGGVTFNEILWGTIIMLKCGLAGGL
jgi:bacteriocin-like protein